MRESAIIVVVSSLAATAAAETRFLAALDDVPMAPGLEETADDVLMFSSPEGRIVETRAKGAIEPAAISSYYRSALPALGWSSSGSGLAFVRGRERLTLHVEEDAPNRVSVRFRMVTRQGPPVLD